MATQLPFYNEPIESSLLERIQPIQLIIFDFDGVFTPNSVYLDQNGVETVKCSRFDGFGLRNIQSMGVKVFVLSKEKNPVVARRCEKLKIDFSQGEDDKLTYFKLNFLSQRMTADQVAYVGNDINDLEMLQAVGLPILVADAHPSVVRDDFFQANLNGGEGVVREVCDLLARGKNESL